jgi:hypothetical protein
VIDKLVEVLEHSGVISESIAGMSQSFGTNNASIDINGLLSPYMRFRSL